MGPFDQTPYQQPPQQKPGGLFAGLGLAGNVFGALTGFAQQKAANKFNVDMWNRQNLYNSPKEQMKRLQQAGLNPNLVYGGGSGGASGTATNAPNFEKLADASYRPVDIPSAIGSLQSFTDWDIKKATADNLVAKTETEKQASLLKTAETAGKILSNSKLSQELPYAGELAKTSLQAAQANVKKTQADTSYTLNQDERARLANDANLRESTERILTSRLGRQQTRIIMQNQEYEGAVKKFQAELANQGIDPSHPYYAKYVERFFNELFGEGGPNPNSAVKKSSDALKWIMRAGKYPFGYK